MNAQQCFSFCVVNFLINYHFLCRIYIVFSEKTLLRLNREHERFYNIPFADLFKCFPPLLYFQSCFLSSNSESQTHQKCHDDATKHAIILLAQPRYIPLASE